MGELLVPGSLKSIIDSMGLIRVFDEGTGFDCVVVSLVWIAEVNADVGEAEKNVLAEVIVVRHALELLDDIAVAGQGNINAPLSVSQLSDLKIFFSGGYAFMRWFALGFLLHGECPKDEKRRHRYGGGPVPRKHSGCAVQRHNYKKRLMKSIGESPPNYSFTIGGGVEPAAGGVSWAS